MEAPENANWARLKGKIFGLANGCQSSPMIEVEFF
jgi:hypothetical protein